MTAAPAVVWHGDDGESAALLAVVGRYCECLIVADVCVGTCVLHHMLVFDQRALDGLVWMRRQADRLRREEFSR